MRFFFCVAALSGLAACSPSVPDSAAGVPNTGSGVGFGTDEDFLAQQRARDAALEGNAIPPAGVISPENSGAATPSAQPLSAMRTPLQTQSATTIQTAGVTQTSAGAYTATGGVNAGGTSEDIARETAARLAETSQNSGEAVVHASPSNPAPQTVTSIGGISNENNFDAVGNARSIEADAQLLAQNRAQYQVVQPGTLPSRQGNAGPNIVQYALSTSHPRGTRVYSRAGLNKQAKFERNCAVYASPDLAQTDFLAKGGPRRDRLGLDPDGDGYACGWDPRPFRTAVQN